jgi:hypothetical protein
MVSISWQLIPSQWLLEEPFPSFYTSICVQSLNSWEVFEQFIQLRQTKT